jgi:hypothetical protein
MATEYQVIFKPSQHADEYIVFVEDVEEVSRASFGSRRCC